MPAAPDAGAGFLPQSLDRLAASPQQMIQGLTEEYGEVKLMRQVLSMMILMLRMLPDAAKQDDREWDDWGAR